MTPIAREVVSAKGGPVVCPACGQDSGHARIFRGLDRCANCGFVWLVEIDGIDFPSLYGDDYFAGEEYADYLGQEHALRRSMRRHLLQMNRYGPIGGSLLEVGCAYGFFLDETRLTFTRSVGVDVASGAVAQARERFGVDARVDDFPAMDLAGEFDIVCMWDTLEHVPRPDAFLSKAHAVLRPGGHLFITTGDMGSLNARIRGPKWRQIHPPSHINYFSRETLTRMLDRLGFTVLGIETAAYYHTIADVLEIVALRGGLAGRFARLSARILGKRLGNRLGFWVDLRDILFVAARREG